MTLYFARHEECVSGRVSEAIPTSFRHENLAKGCDEHRKRRKLNLSPEPIALIAEVSNVFAHPAFRFEKSKPIIGLEFEGRILHLPGHHALAKLQKIRRKIIDDPISDVRERMKLARENGMAAAAGLASPWKNRRS